MSNPEVISPVGELSQDQPPRYSVEAILELADAGQLPCPCCEAPLFGEVIVTPDHEQTALLSCSQCTFEER